MLYVPADKPRAIEKARGLAADAIILDLEDAVAPEHKAQARENAKQALLDGGWRVPVLVRVNGLGTEWEHQDREMALLCGAAGLVIPKAQNAKAMSELHLGLALWPMIETPTGVLNAAAIAASQGVAGLLVGANDLARALGTHPHPQRLPLAHALASVVLAARAANKLPIDAVFNDIGNAEGFARECSQGRDFGFAGKTVIHPSQIDIANDIFGVSDEEAQEARALLEAWQAARAKGHSVATYKGALVEQMHADEAQERLNFWQATKKE